ncbi:Helix-turn-helix domain protein [Roseovarius albus]|uniref:Helix-turn-helix domain protein n=1 Tax=Roseovarius albus TaxID=1247867 RepID=A0A1X6Z3B5_9RHOB|nr:helix-turn-helix domain-containing protein [Roseovarius albus]SLN39082.1 Helix-turn-helix domain protein [Roseovarius albus]
MAKSFSASHIKTHRVYSTWEAADALGCHKQTVIRWIKHKGLNADTSQRPWLIEGRELKAYLGVKQKRLKRKLALHHCFCLGCREPREPDGKIADYIHQTADCGRLEALCPACGSIMNKIVRRADLETIQAKIAVTVQKAHPRFRNLLSGN